MAKRKVCESTEISPKVAKSPPKRSGQTIQARYQSELKKLQRLTKDVIPDDRRNAIMPLMSNIAFLKVKLDQARNELMGESIFTEYDNAAANQAFASILASPPTTSCSQRSRAASSRSPT